MSTMLRFSILGDSNVKRHLNPVNCRDRPLMSGSQLLPCGHLAVLAETLRAIREESNVVVVSCLTNFLTQSEEAGSVTFRIDPVLREAHQVICDFAVNHAEVSFIVAPPMYRLVPLWYRDGMPEVLIKFSETFRDKPPNVHLMQSFPTPDLEGDGVHLTAYSGMEFMLHLFDASRALLENSQLPQDEVTNLVSEQARALEDRVVSLEQDHRRLNKSVEKKSAQDAELADFQINHVHRKIGFGTQQHFKTVNILVEHERMVGVSADRETLFVRQAGLFDININIAYGTDNSHGLMLSPPGIRICDETI